MPSGRRFAAPAGRPGGDPVRVVQRVGDARAPSPAGSPVPPKHDQPAPASLRVEPLRLRDLAPRRPGRGSRGARSSAGTGDDPCRGHERVARLLGVEEEAAVVVGDALRRRSACTPPASRRSRRVSPARGASGPLRLPPACCDARRRSNLPPAACPRERASSRCCARRACAPPARRRRASAAGRPRRHDCSPARLPRSGRRSTRSAARCSSGNGAMPPSDGSRAHFSRDDRCDVAREARRCEAP